MDLTRGTFSIVAVDADAGEVGCAVQSKYFAVGSVVPWAKAGVGAVATQAAGVAVYGPRILAQLEAGRSPQEAIDEVLSGDDGRETRQLGVVDAAGETASWTGKECNAWAGSAAGAGFTAQGNILAGEAVVTGMARAYEETRGSLAERLVSALEAGQAAGGDVRGQQSAAVVVERIGASSRREGIDRVVDLRVDDHVEPIVELRRLLGIQQRWELILAAHARYTEKDYAGGIAMLAEGLERWPDDAMLLYNLACFESLAGRREDAVAHALRSLELDGSLRLLAGTDSDLDPIRAELGL